MAEAGVSLRYELTRHAVMWFGKVLGQLGTFVSVVKLADQSFADERPDAELLPCA